MASHSAGLLMYRRKAGLLEVLLVHPGGPFWANKDAHSWTIPKGLIETGESAEAAARREFAEETGSVADGFLRGLGDVVQTGGKRVSAFACEGDLDVAQIKSNVFELEWPPKSGQKSVFPEIDRAGWFTLDAARERILASQRPLLDRLIAAIDAD